MKKLFCFWFTLLFILNLSACAPKTTLVIQTQDHLILHFIDVGQGDSVFIEYPNSPDSLLIDAGDKQYGYKVSKYIKDLGYNEITSVVATHPHSDHIGGLVEVFENFEVKSFYMPNAREETKVFQNLLESVQNEGLEPIFAKQSLAIVQSESFSAKFLSPVSKNYKDINDYSAVVKIEYIDNEFLFMGDATSLVEKEILNNCEADVVKVGHHGSKTSSSQEFVDKTGARIAIFSVGLDNSYSHPNGLVLKRWLNLGANILRTDTGGSITIKSNGRDLSLIKDNNEEQVLKESIISSKLNNYKFVLNLNSKKIHLPSCSLAKNINSSNVDYSNESSEHLLYKGFSYCKICSKQ